jgi:hypothetical protein
LLKSGLAPVKLHQYGFIIDDKFIVAAQKNRWCVRGRMVWYWYRSEQDLAERILRERRGEKWQPPRGKEHKLNHSSVTGGEWLEVLTQHAAEYEKIMAGEAADHELNAKVDERPSYFWQWWLS